MKVHFRRCLHVLLAAGLLLAAGAGLSQGMKLETNADEFLPPDEAFRMSVERTDTGHVARWVIASGYYLYRDKIRIEARGADLVSRLPPGETMRDEFFGETEVFRYFVEVPFAPQSENVAAELSVSYQGCADAGLCYPPVTKQLSLTGTSAPATASPPRSTAPVSEQFLILDRLKGGSLFFIILSFFGFGLLLALTPCILPMVPILSAIIARGGSGEKLSTGRAFLLSLSYVLALAFTYSLFGVATGLAGESLQVWLQTPWVIGAFAGLFVLLALSMFGLYELRMPSSIQTRLSTVGNNGTGGRPALANAALMGAASALIVGPCVTAPLIGALLFIAQTGDAVVGAAALFFLALGMGVPLLIIGTSLGRLLPSPGERLDAVKPVFGLLMLGVAIWLLDRVVSSEVVLWLSGALLALTAVCLFQLARRGAFRFGGEVLVQGAATVVLVYGVLLIAGAATGGSSLLRPLEHLVMKSSGGGAPVRENALAFRQVGSLQDLRAEIMLAEQRGQGVMLDFYADWCVSCKEMEAFTFSTEQVRTATADLTLLQVDVTDNSDANRELLGHFGLFGPPAILFFAHGYEIETARVVGYVDADRFARHLDEVFSIRRT